MELLSPTTFRSHIASSGESLRKIAVLIEEYCGPEAGQGFTKACETVDYDTANRHLNELVMKLTRVEPTESVYYALEVFAEKFTGLGPDFQKDISAAETEMAKIKAMDKYYDRMIEAIMQGQRTGGKKAHR